MTAAEAPLAITEPGIYPEVTHTEYLSDPVAGGSLSSTGARRILPPGCPALFRYEQEHGRPDKRSFDVGSAAHNAVLGCGPEIVVVDAPDWRTKAAQTKRDEARARGAVPILADEAERVHGMAEALRAHPIASRLLDPAKGVPETTLVWRDEHTGVALRARLDILPNSRGGRMLLSDYKSTTCAEPTKFVKSAGDYGYHQQGAFYADGVRALGLADDIAFLLIAQEVTPPYLISVVQLDVNAMRIGALLNRRAVDLYARCKSNNHWPAYSDDIELMSLPVWIERQFEEELS